MHEPKGYISAFVLKGRIINILQHQTRIPQPNKIEENEGYYQAFPKPDIVFVIQHRLPV
jgi:hypothetical protein